jgi:hypothetical protein
MDAEFVWLASVMQGPDSVVFVIGQFLEKMILMAVQRRDLASFWIYIYYRLWSSLVDNCVLASRVIVRI